MYRQTTVAGLPAVALYNDTLELIALPSAGGRITHLRRRRGREWLWHNPVLPFEVPPAEPGPSPSIYVDRYDSGGWDECFPTVGACPMPGTGAPLPDHGELWFARWRHDVYTSAGRTTWRSVAECHTVPAIFTRRVEVPDAADDDGRVTLHYAVRSTGSAPFPFLWSSHPLFTAQPGTRIELPGISEVKVDAVLGRDDLLPEAELRWPEDQGLLAAVGAIQPHPGALSLVMPPREGWATKLFAQAPAEGRAIIIDPARGESLELLWDGARVPFLGVWINPGGFGPVSSKHYTLAVEPCLAGPDRLDRAVAPWGLAPILHPQEERTWTLTVVLRDESR